MSIVVSKNNFPKTTRKDCLMAIIRMRKKTRKSAAIITKVKFIKALQNTGGISKMIAEKLNCTRITVNRWKKKDDEDIQNALRDEIDAIADIAENTILTMMEQRLDFGVSARTAKWYLERKREGYKERKEVTLEGGKIPIHVQNETLLPLDTLDLPLAVRKQILAAMEQKEKEEGKRGKNTNYKNRY